MNASADSRRPRRCEHERSFLKMSDFGNSAAFGWSREKRQIQYSLYTRGEKNFREEVFQRKTDYDFGGRQPFFIGYLKIYA